jgi:hypothetical protein
MSRLAAAAVSALVATIGMAVPATVAQIPEASSGTGQEAAVAWPTGDELRRDLQTIGFVFRVDGATGDWFGWAPPVDATTVPAVQVDGAGTTAAAASFELLLIGGDPSLPLTAYMEVASRLPLRPSDVDRARRFVVEDLLQAPPETLESCYVSDWERGAALVTVDAETTTARLHLAEDARAIEAFAASVPDDAECAELIPSEVAAELGDPSSERVSIAMRAAGSFDPAEVELTGALVTVVLTFTNESAVEQTLTFEAPLEASTGPVEPAGTRLIVVRQLQPGEYPFFSEADPDGLRGTLRIEEPRAD